MKSNKRYAARRTPAALLLAALLLTEGALTGCSSIREYTAHFREEYAPNSGFWDGSDAEGETPPPIIRPGEDGGSDKPDEQDGQPEETEQAPSGEEHAPAEGTPTTKVTLKAASSANEISLLVARYGCVLTTQSTPDGVRKGYHYVVDSPGGVASVEFCDMRETPLGCFGSLLTADGTVLTASVVDYNDPSQPVRLTEAENPADPFENPFKGYAGADFRVTENGDSEITVHAETKDSERRADFVLNARSLEIVRKTEYTADGEVRETEYTLGAERFGAERLSAALTDYYAMDPEDLTFTLDDVRAANSLTSLIAAHGAASYTLKNEEAGQAPRETVTAYETGGRRIVVTSVVSADGKTETRYYCDGVSWPDANGCAYLVCGSADSSETVFSSLIPQGVIGSVTESGDSVLFTVRYTKSGSPAMARVIVDKSTLRMRSCEAELLGDNARTLYEVSFVYGGQKTGESQFASLGEGRRVTCHVEWVNAPAEDYVWQIPGTWTFRLMFYSDASCWYDAAHTSPAPADRQVPADGWDYELWVTGAVRYRNDDTSVGALPGVKPSDVTLSDIARANGLSNLVAQYGSLTERKGGDVFSFRKNASLWVRYSVEAGVESGKYGPVQMTAQDGWISYAADYGDVTEPVGTAYEYEDRYSSLLLSAAENGTLRELVPSDGQLDSVRRFLLTIGTNSHILFDVRRDTLALLTWTRVENGSVKEERSLTLGEFAQEGETFMVQWNQARTVIYHVLDQGEEVAVVGVKIPQISVFNLEMPEGWNWFFADAALTEEVGRWYQVPPGDTDVIRWTDNRDPAERPAAPAPAPAEETPAEEGPPAGQTENPPEEQPDDGTSSEGDSSWSDWFYEEPAPDDGGSSDSREDGGGWEDSSWEGNDGWEDDGGWEGNGEGEGLFPEVPLGTWD